MSSECGWFGVRDWDNLQQRLIECGATKENLWALSKDDKWDVDWNVEPDFKMGVDAISPRRLGRFMDVVEQIGRLCQEEQRAAWQRVFYAVGANGRRLHGSDAYLLNFNELRMPDNYRDSQVLSVLNTSLGPATVARVSEWARTINIDDYADAFARVADKDWFEEWDDFVRMARFWFEMLQRTQRSHYGLLQFIF